MTQSELGWQSKLVLLVVLPVVGTDVVLETNFWAGQDRTVVLWTLGLSALLGLVTWKLRAATAQAAATGAAITANLMFSTVTFPYDPWHTAMVPVLAVSLLAYAATRIGRAKKEQLGTAEARKGRSAAQVAANLGVAALVASDVAQMWMAERHGIAHAAVPLFAAGLAAMAEAAADTVSSETGQVFGGRPRMITTLRAVDPGTDGAVSVAGTLAGIVAAAVVAGLGTWALRGDGRQLLVAATGGVFGLFFDSLLGATLEARGWLNNDAVNFLSTASAAGFAMAVIR
ncbi:MAG TPA: DUF92 domain-containing protein [Terracidiphilus sp.]|nr:DUF92 domain-containing protein [Terracidiphilus sp.]